MVRHASRGSAAGPTIGPVQINALGRPGLCWQAGGNGSAVTLEHVIAAAFLLGGGLLMLITGRTRPPARHSLPRRP